VNLKKITIALAAMVFFCTANTIYAEPLQVYGDVRIRYQDRTGDVEPAKAPGSHTITRIRVNMEAPLADKFSVYGRLAVEQAAGLQHNNGLYDTAGVFDRWGAEYKFSSGSVKLGKQDIVLGQDGLVLMTLIDAVGKDNQLTGATVTLKTDKNTTIQLIGGRLGSGLFQPAEAVKANLYAVQVSNRIDRRLSVGATWRRIAAIDDYSALIAKLIGYNTEFDTYSLSGNYYLGNKTVVYTEVGQSNADKFNKAFSIGIAHMFDKKNSMSVNYFKQDVQAIMLGNWGAPDFTVRNGSTTWKGYANYYRHQMDKSTLLEISDYYEKGNNTKSANQFRLNVIKSF